MICEGTRLPLTSETGSQHVLTTPAKMITKPSTNPLCLGYRRWTIGATNRVAKGNRFRPSNLAVGWEKAIPNRVRSEVIAHEETRLLRNTGRKS